MHTYCVCICLTTLSNGSLGSWVDEERSQLRELMWIAGHLEHRHLERTLRPQVFLRPCLAEGRLYTSSKLYFCCVDSICCAWQHARHRYLMCDFDAFWRVLCNFLAIQVVSKCNAKVCSSEACCGAQLDGLLLWTMPFVGCCAKT